MTYTPDNLIRNDIEQMEVYTPIVPFEVLSARLGIPPEQIVKLDANENPYGPSPKIYQALADERFYHIYPDPESRALRKKLSDFLDISQDSIMVGSGVDELLDLIIRLFIQPGDAIINCPPTFGMYSFDAAIGGAQTITVPRFSDFSIDCSAIERAVSAESRAKLVFLTSPNNPDGGVVSDEDLRRLLHVPLIVILDEAYVEFSGKSRIKWVETHSNLIVLRTFSKWAGLGGLRVGYGAFPEDIIKHLWKIKQPYNVNVAGTAAALASLDDFCYLQQNINKIIAERERLYQELGRIEFLRPYPSQSNFILCQVIDHDAHHLKLELEKRGILLRYYDKPGLLDHIRVSVGLPEHTDRLMAELATL